MPPKGKRTAEHDEVTTAATLLTSNSQSMLQLAKRVDASSAVWCKGLQTLLVEVEQGQAKLEQKLVVQLVPLTNDMVMAATSVAAAIEEYQRTLSINQDLKRKLATANIPANGS